MIVLLILEGIHVNHAIVFMLYQYHVISTFLIIPADGVFLHPFLILKLIKPIEIYSQTQSV